MDMMKNFKIYVFKICFNYPWRNETADLAALVLQQNTNSVNISEKGE
jgi:hypothetical protein